MRVNWPRIITAAVLAFAVIVLVTTLGDFWFDLICGGIILMGVWEWTLLKKLDIRIFLMSLVPLAVVFLLGRGYPDFLMFVCVLASLAWLGIGVDLVAGKGGWLQAVLNSYVSGLFLLSGAWAALVLIHSWDAGSLYLISVLMMIWTADSFAYLAGKRFGRKKLAPALSPGKTVEGAVGGIAGTVALALITGLAMLHLTGEKLLLWVGMGLVIALTSVIGDLHESRLKRIAGVKDSGRILPGHGGILDRIDSMLVALPATAAGWSLIR